MGERKLAEQSSQHQEKYGLKCTCEYGVMYDVYSVVDAKVRGVRV